MRCTKCKVRRSLRVGGTPAASAKTTYLFKRSSRGTFCCRDTRRGKGRSLSAKVAKASAAGPVAAEAAATKKDEGAAAAVATAGEGSAGTTTAAGSAGAVAAKKDEPSSYSLQNPARVVPSQVKFISFNSDSR